jgi:ferredoxin-NADP reductase
MLSRHLTDKTAAIYYITGPPGMMRETLTSATVDDDDIRTEEFYLPVREPVSDRKPGTEAIVAPFRS